MTPRTPLSYLLALWWTLGAAACLSWVLHLSVVLRPAAAGDVVQLGAVEALVFVLGVLGVVALHGPDVPLSASLGTAEPVSQSGTSGMGQVPAAGRSSSSFCAARRPNTSPSRRELDARRLAP